MKYYGIRELQAVLGVSQPTVISRLQRAGVWPKGFLCPDGRSRRVWHESDLFAAGIITLPLTVKE